MICGLIVLTPLFIPRINHASRPQLHDTELLFISDYLAKSVITTMFDFAADFGTDVRNVSDLASYTATGTCRIGFYITSEAE